MPDVAGPEELNRVRSTVMAALRDKADAAEAVKVVCLACVELLPVDGASISVMTDEQHRATVYASDEIVSRIENLQFSLGEGPCFEAFNTQRPVLVADLARALALAWPAFAEEMIEQPVAAIFAFPLQNGAINLGAMDLYRRLPGWLSPQEVALALALVDIATTALLVLQLRALDEDDGEGESWLVLSTERKQVHQATGILIAAFGIPAEQALARLRGYAFATGRLVDDVARDIVTRRIAPTELDQ